MRDPIRAKELPRFAWAEDKARAEEAVVGYLARCREGVDGDMNVDDLS